MCVNTGWDWNHVDQTMTMPKLQALEEIWKTNPSPAIALRAIAEANGYKVDRRRSKKKTKGQAKELADMIKGLQ